MALNLTNIDFVAPADNLPTGAAAINSNNTAISNNINAFNKRDVADGASAVAWEFDTDNDLTTGGAKLLSLKNFGAEKVYIDKDGGVLVGNGSVSNPSLGWASDADGAGTGFYRPNPNQLALAINGYQRFFLHSSLFKVDVSEWNITQGGLSSSVADGATAVAYSLDTANTFATSGASLLNLSNNGTTVFRFNLLGGIDHQNSGATTEAHEQSINLNFSSDTTKTSSGQYSCVIGSGNTASAAHSFAIGATTTASGLRAFAFGNLSAATGNTASAGGYKCTNSGLSTFAHGYDGVVTGDTSAAFGREFDSGLDCTITLGGEKFATRGDAQVSFSALKVVTTDATQTTMQLNNGNMVIPADTTWAFSALISARSDETDGNVSAIWKIEGGIKRDEANNTTLIGTPTITTIAKDTDAAAWDVTAEADDTNEVLAIKVTGEAATNIRWVAKVDISQVTYA